MSTLSDTLFPTRRASVLRCVSCDELLPTSVAVVLMAVQARGSVSHISLTDADAHEATHLTLLPLHPWQLVEARTTRLRPGARSELTWRSEEHTSELQSLMRI